MAIVIESYRLETDADATTAVFALHRKCFGEDRPAQEWHWRYLANPAADGVTVIAREASSSHIVGHQAITPVFLNLRGKRVLGAQSGDSMVDPETRGGGVFEALLRRSEEDAKACAVALIYGFPGPMSLPVFLQKCAWDRVVQLTDFRYDLDRRAKLRAVVRFGPLVSALRLLVRGVTALRVAVDGAVTRRAVGDAILRQSDVLPPNYAAFWKMAARFEVLSLWKDADYMQWRYDRNPTHAYRYHWIERDGVILCLAVTRDDGDDLIITELIAIDKMSPLSRHLLSQILRYALRKGSGAVSFQGADSGFFARAFRAFGSVTDLAKVFAILPLEDLHEARGAMLAANWSVALGDWDGV